VEIDCDDRGGILAEFPKASVVVGDVCLGPMVPLRYPLARLAETGIPETVGVGSRRNVTPGARTIANNSGGAGAGTHSDLGMVGDELQLRTRDGVFSTRHRHRPVGDAPRRPT